MLKTYLYLPEELDEQVKRIAKKQKSSKAFVIRVALEKGLKQVEDPVNNSAEILMKLAAIGEKYKSKGPKDLSQNMDKHLWEDYEK